LILLRKYAILVEGGFPGFSSKFRPAATYVLPFFRANSRDMDGQKLTKRVVDGLEIKANDYVFWCGQLPGFGCRVWPSGKKTFIVMYRAGGAKSPTRKVTIGVLGKFTVEQARAEAVRILAQAELGEDEAAKRASFRAEMTVAELCDEYMLEGVDHKKPSTIASDHSRIDSHIKPLLGKKRISEVTSADVSKFLRDIANGKARRDQKTAKKRGRSIVRGGKGTATRTVRFLGGIFTYAVKRGYLKENPKKGVELYPDKKGERFLSAEEFQRLGEALRLAETDGIPWTLVEGRKAKHRPVKEENRREVFSPHVVAAFRLLLFTGCRLGEILTLKWDYVDFQRGMLNLPDSKTGKKSVLLASPALQILSDLPRLGPYVIAGQQPDKPRADLQRPWRRLTSHTGLKGLRIHDLRHSFASVGAESGMGLLIVGKLLGHADQSTTARYAHLGNDPLRRAAETVAGTIAAAIGPAKANANDADDKPQDHET
jgi:integrase